LALSASYGKVLLAIDLECYRRPHASGLSGGDIPENLAFVCRQRAQVTIAQCLKDDVARGSDGSATDTPATLRAPFFFLSDDVPCHEP
jgi:hypothetical protein